MQHGYDTSDGQVDKTAIFSYGQLKSKPQRAGLNVHTNLSVIHHAQYSFITWCVRLQLAGN